MAVALPAGMPRQLLAGHERQSADMAEPCEFESGEPRLAPTARSVPTVMPVRWSLTQAQFDAYDEWFEADLQAGHLSFLLPVPSEGGDATASTELEAMFLEMPVETQRTRDNWLVEGRVVTGVSFDLPADDPCVNETFGSGLAAYSNIAGTTAGFSNFTTGSYGQGLRMTAAAGPSSSCIERTFTARDVFSIRFKFRVEALNSDDAGILQLYAGGTRIFYFDPRRELLFSGGIGNAVGAIGISASPTGLSAAALDVNEWHQFQLVCAASSDVVITRLSDSTVVGTTAVGDLSAGLAGVDSLRFLFDEGGATMSTSSYADIHICGAEG